MICLELASPVASLQFSLVHGTMYKSIPIHPKAFWFLMLCCYVCLSCFICTLMFLLYKIPLTNILVEFLMGLPVSKCDEFSMFNWKSSGNIYIQGGAKNGLQWFLRKIIQ